MDPIEELIAQKKSQSDQNYAFYSDKLKGIIGAYRMYTGKYDRDGLVNMTVKALMESENTREDLCYMLMVSIDKAARG